MDRPSRFPLYLGIVVICAGWVVLLVGWYQAGRQDLETGQIPYVLSGGFGGIGLLAMGGMAVVTDFVRQAEWRASRRTDELRAAVEQAVSRLARPSRPAPLPEGEPPPRQAARRPRRRRRRPSGSGAGGSEA